MATTSKYWLQYRGKLVSYSIVTIQAGRHRTGTMVSAANNLLVLPAAEVIRWQYTWAAPLYYLYHGWVLYAYRIYGAESIIQCNLLVWEADNSIPGSATESVETASEARESSPSHERWYATLLAQGYYDEVDGVDQSTGISTTRSALYRRHSQHYSTVQIDCVGHSAGISTTW